jgi:CRP-like cAMP-binding protein
MQITGTGFKIGASDLEGILQESPALNTGLLRFSQVLAMQATQIAACNRFHEVDRRLARWLLMSQDRVGGDSVSLTQETLANMLGTRRASVTVAAGALQKQGLITYRRGDVKIDNRPGLAEASCECYETMKRQAEMWKNEGAS